MITSCKNWSKQVNAQKYTPMSSFGLIEENMELSHIHLAVLEIRIIILCTVYLQDHLVFGVHTFFYSKCYIKKTKVHLF